MLNIVYGIFVLLIICGILAVIVSIVKSVASFFMVGTILSTIVILGITGVDVDLFMWIFLAISARVLVSIKARVQR